MSKWWIVSMWRFCGSGCASGGWALFRGHPRRVFICPRPFILGPRRFPGAVASGCSSRISRLTRTAPGQGESPRAGCPRSLDSQMDSPARLLARRPRFVAEPPYTPARQPDGPAGGGTRQNARCRSATARRSAPAGLSGFDQRQLRRPRGGAVRAGVVVVREGPGVVLVGERPRQPLGHEVRRHLVEVLVDVVLPFVGDTN